MSPISRSPGKFFGLIIYSAILTGAATAQSSSTRVSSSDGYFLPLILFVIAVGSFGAAYFLWSKSKRKIETSQYRRTKQVKNYSKNETFNLDGVDAAKEMEWLRKSKIPNGAPAKRKLNGPTPKKPIKQVEPENLDTRSFQENMRKLQYAQLPINSFTDLRPAGPFEPLPESDDAAVLDAIEQVNDEYETDEAIREIALRILTAFRTRNSVEALSQIALYDLSSNLRSRAVATLTDFDHESVFETILLACADPTREVRAAAARGLFKLNFDRAKAWKRIIETNDEFRMSHAARAALEAGIVVKSFDRLVHEDRKIAYEAFCLVSLLIKSGETEAIYKAIRTHKDERVRFALLHVLKVVKDERTRDELFSLNLDAEVPTDVAQRVREALESFEMAKA